MALFAYRAIDAEGKISIGNLDAVNAFDLELRLKRLGLDLAHVREREALDRRAHAQRHAHRS